MNETAAAIRSRLDRPIVLTGLMGVGKTRIGGLLADALDLPFIDSDSEIERAAGLGVSEIFEKFGEAHFRDGEHRVIKRLLAGPPSVISTGGGAIMTPATAELVWDKAVSVWIRAELPVMLERVSRNDRRPLLKNGDPEAILKDLMEKRYSVYGKADIVVQSHNGPAEPVRDQALEKLHEHLLKRAP